MYKSDNLSQRGLLLISSKRQYSKALFLTQDSKCHSMKCPKSVKKACNTILHRHSTSGSHGWRWGAWWAPRQCIWVAPTPHPGSSEGCGHDLWRTDAESQCNRLHEVLQEVRVFYGVRELLLQRHELQGTLSLHRAHVQRQGKRSF